LLIVLLIVTPAELSRVPFDTPEAETELAGGILVEYSGKNLALFSLTQGVKTVAMASLVVALFFPYRLAAIAGISGFAGAVIDLLVYIVLITLVAFISVSVIRVAMARFRINQVVSVYWIYLAIAGLAGLLLVMVDQIMGVV
ncbi:MAG TPA: NADH-quinone oxidoreductase subunit H, partial [Methanoregulaceae archaeon]|nr:NADH-quinone oxidoreductase subunit H [Methanoregulaceae archaeon]